MAFYRIPHTRIAERQRTYVVYDNATGKAVYSSKNQREAILFSSRHKARGVLTYIKQE